MSNDLLLKRLINLLRENGMGEMEAHAMALEIFELLRKEKLDETFIHSSDGNLSFSKFV